VATLNHWLNELACEIFERLEKDLLENNRTSKLMTVSYTQELNNEDVASTRSVPLPLPYDQERIVKDAFEAIKRNTEQFAKPDNVNMLNNSIKFLGISCSKFENNPDVNQKNKLQALFNNHSKKGESGRESPVAGSSSTYLDTVVVEKVETEKKSIEPKGNIISFFKNHSKKTIETNPAEEEVPVVADKKVEHSTISSFFKNSKNIENEEDSAEIEPEEDFINTNAAEQNDATE
jgi:DNA polymerase eta